VAVYREVAVSFDLQSAPLWVKFIVVYFLIGWCTQLPGGLFRPYKHRWAVSRNYALYGSRALLDTPFVWIPFTILLWPVSFLRAGLNLVALGLILLGVLAAAGLIRYVTTIAAAGGVVLVSGLVSLYLARPRGRRVR
jgi:hypothetical protein